MNEKNITRTKALLEKLSISAEIIAHPHIDGTHSEDVMKALNISLNNIIKCLILQSKKGNLVATIILGNQRLDFKKLEILSGEKKFRLAPPELVKNITQFDIGGVPPIAVSGHMPVFIDPEVLKQETIVGSAGTPFHGLKLSPKELLKLKPTISQIS